jgi:hypothetical protein
MIKKYAIYNIINIENKLISLMTFYTSHHQFQLQINENQTKLLHKTNLCALSLFLRALLISSHTFSAYLIKHTSIGNSYVVHESVPFPPKVETASPNVRNILSSPIKPVNFDAWNFSTTIGPGFATRSC